MVRICSHTTKLVRLKPPSGGDGLQIAVDKCQKTVKSRLNSRFSYPEKYQAEAICDRLLQAQEWVTGLFKNEWLHQKSLHGQQEENSSEQRVVEVEIQRAVSRFT